MSAKVSVLKDDMTETLRVNKREIRTRDNTRLPPSALNDILIPKGNPLNKMVEDATIFLTDENLTEEKQDTVNGFMAQKSNRNLIGHQSYIGTKYRGSIV